MTGKTALHWLLCRLGLQKPHTQTTDAERLLIAAYSKGGLATVEIGVYEGRTTAVIAKSIDEKGKLYAVDPFYSGRLGIAYGKLIARHYLLQQGVLSKIQFLEMLSHDAAPLIQEKLDFVFIDGDHSYEGISRDWQDWCVKIKPDGFIALHDTCIPPGTSDHGILGSHKYFNEVIRFDPRFKLVEQVDSLSILQKISG